LLPHQREQLEQLEQQQVYDRSGQYPTQQQPGSSTLHQTSRGKEHQVQTIEKQPRHRGENISKYFMRRMLEAEMAAEQEGATTANKDAAVKARETYNGWAAKRRTVWAGEKEYINAWKTAAKNTQKALNIEK
jgi:hypothetical protein